MLLLLGSGPMEDAPAAGSSQSSELIQTDISQYSVESGRSACTCIALTRANLYLQNPAISSDLLRNMVMQGVDTYQRISQSESGIEHMCTNTNSQIGARRILDYLGAYVGMN